MRKRDFLGGVLATAGAFIPQWAKAAFGIFQLNGPGGGGGGAGIPAGVAFQAIDGESVTTGGVQTHSYYSSNGMTFAVAAAGLGGGAPGITFNGINYPLGWDDPGFFSIGVWLAPWGYSPTAEVARWKAIGLNTSTGTNITVAGARAQFRSNGISSLDGYQYMGTSIAIDGAPGTEAVGINLYDEPQRLEQVEVSFIGNAAATFTASVTDNLMTVTAQSGGAALWQFDSSYDLAILTGTGLVASGVSQQIDGYGSSTSVGGVGTYALRDYGTSSTSMTVGTGSQSLTLDAAVTGPFVGQIVHLIENIPAGTKAMTGTITVYTGGPGLTFNCTSFTGSGTQNTWIVFFQAPSETITQKIVAPLPTSIQNNRFMVLNHPAAAWLVFPSLAGLSRTLSASSLYTQLYLAPDGITQRHVDALGTDYYAFPAAYSQTVGGGSQQLNNIYQNGYLPIMTPDQVAKGPHYGNFIDYMRVFQTTYKVPIGTFIDNSNSNSGIAYDTQAIETNWAVWSCIIHGGRQITYFNYVDVHSPSGCTGFFEGSDNFNCTVMQTAQTASVTSSISGTTLTVTAVSSGVVCPGMVSTAGVSGQIVVLQQTNNFSTPGKVATYTIAVISGAGTGSPTAFSQSNIGMGGVSNASNVFPAPFSLLGMRQTLTLTNTLIRTMAPVINSPFAVAASGTVGAGNGYIIGTSPTAAYIFPYLGVKSGAPPQSIDYGLAGSSGLLAASAVDCCTKYYSGSTYTATTGDSISAGFYIFATTRYPETKTPNFNVSFTINDPLATSITVIGESRNISIGSGIGTNSVTFTDHFDFAWTCRIYRVNH